MINYIERKRKRLSLLFATLMLVLVIFISFFGAKIETLSEAIETSEEFRQENLEDFKELHISMNQTILDNVERDWNRFTLPDDEISQGLLKDFISTHVESTRELTKYFIIAMTRDGSLHYEGYSDARYNTLDLNQLYPSEDVNVIGENGDFSTEDRFYYNSRVIESEDTEVIVYVGFLEQVVYDSYVNSYDIQSLEKMKRDTELLTIVLSAIMLILAVLGITILFQLVQLGRNFKIDEMSKYTSMYLISEAIDNKDPEAERLVREKLNDKDLVSLSKLFDKLMENFTV